MLDYRKTALFGPFELSNSVIKYVEVGNVIKIHTYTAVIIFAMLIIRGSWYKTGSRVKQ